MFDTTPDPRYFQRGVRGPAGSFPDHVPDDLDVPIPPFLPDTDAVRRDVRRVYSNIVELDQQIGIVLNQLKQEGLLDSTIVVFYSDNGGPLPHQKRLLYDSGLHVPMIVRLPGRRPTGTATTSSSASSTWHPPCSRWPASNRQLTSTDRRSSVPSG